MVFWNVAGMGYKFKDFWKGLKQSDVLVLLETWVEEKGWIKIRERLPNKYEWAGQWVKKKSKKGRGQ